MQNVKEMMIHVQSKEITKVFSESREEHEYVIIGTDKETAIRVLLKYKPCSYANNPLVDLWPCILVGDTIKAGVFSDGSKIGDIDCYTISVNCNIEIMNIPNGLIYSP